MTPADLLAASMAAELISSCEQALVGLETGTYHAAYERKFNNNSICTDNANSLQTFYKHLRCVHKVAYRFQT